MIIQGASLDDLPQQDQYPDWAAWNNTSPFCPTQLHNMPNSIKKFRTWIKSKPWHEEGGKLATAAHATKFLIAVGMLARDLHASQFAEEDDGTVPSAVLNTKQHFAVINDTFTPLCEDLLTDLSAAAKPRPSRQPANAKAGPSKRKIQVPPRVLTDRLVIDPYKVSSTRPHSVYMPCSHVFKPGLEIQQEIGRIFFGTYSDVHWSMKDMRAVAKKMFRPKKRDPRYSKRLYRGVVVSWRGPSHLDFHCRGMGAADRRGVIQPAHLSLHRRGTVH